MILPMPAGTDPERVQDAVLAFARQSVTMARLNSSKLAMSERMKTFIAQAALVSMKSTCTAS